MSADNGLTRAEFLKRVRDGLGGSTGTAPHLEVPDDLVRRIPIDTDRRALFIERASAAGATLHACSVAELGARVAELVQGSTQVAVELDGDDQERVHEALEARGIPYHLHRRLEDHYQTDIAVTPVAAAVAETGTILVQSGRDRSRGAPLLPRVHVAIVYEPQIVPDLVDVWTHFAPNAAYSVLITGPSKTADIEGVLITGVHGPAELHIVLVREA